MITGIVFSFFKIPYSFSAPNYKPGEVLVKYKSGVFKPRLRINALYDKAGVDEVRHYKGAMKGFDYLILNEGVNVEETIVELEQSDSVEYAQPNYILETYPIEPEETQETEDPLLGKKHCLNAEMPVPEMPALAECSLDKKLKEKPALNPMPEEVIPAVADPNLNKSYALFKMGVDQAWSINQGSKDIIVADIDTGIDYNHEDLSFNLWRNPNPSNKQDIVGFDFIHNDGLPYDDQQHGTHTAGIIGAVGGNGIGSSGVSQRVSLMALKFINSEGIGTTADAVSAINYAISHGAKIINSSWGGKADQENKILHESIIQAKEHGVLFISAAGNDKSDNDGDDPNYPAAFTDDNIISVAATDEDDDLAPFSSYGQKTTHIAAPGVNIYSTVPDNKYRKLSGTSMATPYVTGAAVLVWAAHPSWDYQQVKRALLSSVDVIPSLEGKVATSGRLNVLKALQYQE